MSLLRSRRFGALDWALLWTAIVVVIGAGAVTFARVRRDDARRPFIVGQRLELPELRNLPPRSELVIWLSTKCKFCQESMHFYASLTEPPIRRPIIIAGWEPVDDLRAFADRFGVKADFVVSTNGVLAPKLPFTPMLFAVDPNLRIEASWTGLVSDSDRAVIRGMVDVR